MEADITEKYKQENSNKTCEYYEKWLKKTGANYVKETNKGEKTLLHPKLGKKHLSK